MYSRVVAGRASIVGAAATHVGKVREHNEDAHFLDVDAGLFLVCDGMGGHAAGEVASALAIRTIRGEWSNDATRRVADAWLERGTPETRKQLFGAVRAGVLRAHDAIVAEGAADRAKAGMGTTLVGALAIGNELVFAHAGDSRAYLVRDGIAMQLTEDHTLLARLLAAGIDVDVSGEGARFRSMLTNALGIGDECKVSTFVVPLADGDRFLLCSDGISEYVPEAEVGTVLTGQPSPARAAQRLVELALERGGGDNATAVVVRVLEAGETPQPAEQRRRDDAAIERCALCAKISPQQRLRALRVAIPRDHASGERIPAHTLGDRVAWIVVEGQLELRGETLGPGALLYPESLVSDAPPPDRDALATASTDVRALALRADDFRELCDDDAELGEALLDALAPLIQRRGGRITQELPAVRAHDVASGGPDAPWSEVSVPLPVVDPAPFGRPPAPRRSGPRTIPQPPPDAEARPDLEVEVEVISESDVPVPEKGPPERAPPAHVRGAGVAAVGGSSGEARVGSPSAASSASATGASAATSAPPNGAPAGSGAAPSAATPGAPVRKSTRTAAATLPPPPLVARPIAPLPRSDTSGPIARPSPLPPGLQPAGALVEPAKRPSAPRIAPPPSRGTPPPGVATPGAAGPATEPEIETYIELEAEPPPTAAVPASTAAVPASSSEDDIAEMTLSVQDHSGRVTETVTETSEQTLTLTVTEESAAPRRAITAEDGAEVSGTISVETPRRSKRTSDGWDDEPA